MKYNSLTEYFNNKEQLVFYDCLDYYDKFKDEILDSEYGKDDDRVFKKMNALRNALYEIIIEFKNHIQLLFHTLSYYHYEVVEGGMTKDEYKQKTYKLIDHIEYKLMFISNKSNSLTYLLINEFEDIYEDDWAKDVFNLLDDYDKKYNMDKFKYPYIANHLVEVVDYFTLKYTFKDFDELHSESNEYWLKDFINHESKENNA